METDMPNWIEQAEARGEARGRQEGRLEGRQQGTANAVLHLFESTFESVPGGVKARILSADVDQLLVWIDRIPTATSVEDVFGNPEPN